MERGDEVFIPGLFFPKHPNRLSSYPTIQRLRKNLVYTQVELTKQSNVQAGQDCNRTVGYTYGSKYLHLNSWCLLENVLWFIPKSQMIQSFLLL